MSGGGVVIMIPSLRKGELASWMMIHPGVSVR